MAALSFPNFAALRPSPGVAVTRPPEDNTLAFLMSEAISSIRKEAKAKRDVDALKLETNALADYMEKRSPDLASMLRAKTQSYVPDAFNGYGAVDVAEERKGLLRGSLDLYRNEIADRKADISASAVGLQNNWRTKLGTDEKIYEIAKRNESEFEAAENQREEKHKSMAIQMSARGKRMGDYQRRPNPYTTERQAAEERLKETLNKSPQEILADATPSKARIGSNGSIVPSGNASLGDLDLPIQPDNTGGIPLTENPDGNPFFPEGPPPVEAITPEAPAESLVPAPVAPASGTYTEPPVAESPPVLNPGDVVPSNIVPSPPEMRDAAAKTPDQIAIEGNIEAFNKAAQVEKELAKKAINSTMWSIEKNGEDYEGKAQAELNEEKQKALKEIDAVEDPTSTIGQRQISSIIDSFNKMASSTRKRSERSTSSVNRANLVDQPDFYIGKEGVPIEVNGSKQSVKVLKDSTTNKFYIESPDGSIKPADSDIAAGNIVGPAQISGGVKKKTVFDVLNSAIPK